MRLIIGEDDIIAQFVGSGLRRTFHPPFVAIGWVREIGDKWKLVGGAIFNDYNGSNIEISIYGPGALTRQSLRETLRYVFIQCKCNRLTAKTAYSNKHMRKLLPRLGFKLEGTMKRYFGKDEKAMIFRLDPEIAERWL